MKTLFVADDLHCDDRPCSVVPTPEDLPKAATTQRAQHLIPVSNVVSCDCDVVTSGVVKPAVDLCGGWVACSVQCANRITEGFLQHGLAGNG